MELNDQLYNRSCSEVVVIFIPGVAGYLMLPICRDVPPELRGRVKQAILEVNKHFKNP